MTEGAQLNHSDFTSLAEVVDRLRMIEADHDGDPYGEEAGDLAAEIADFQERWA